MQNRRDKNSANIITDELSYKATNKLDASIMNIISEAKKEVDESLKKKLDDNYDDDDVRIRTMKEFFSDSIYIFSQAKAAIGRHWDHVMNSKKLSDELGYTTILKNTMECLRENNNIKEDLKEKCEEEVVVKKKRDIVRQYYSNEKKKSNGRE